VRSYQAIIERYIKEFGDGPVDQVTPEQILTYLNRLTEGNKPYTKRIRFSQLSSFFNFVRNNIDPELRNPCDRPMIRKLYRERVPLRWKIIEKETIDEIIFRTTKVRNRLILELMARGGMRIGEVLKLRLGDLQDRKLVLREPKSGKEYQFVFIPQKVADRLRDYALQVCNEPSDRIFPISYEAARVMVIKSGKMVGVKLRPHDLRRHSATYASRSGVPIEIISKVTIDPVYLCQRHRIERWESSCQYIPGASIDEAISKLLLESVTPLTLDMALQVQKELETRFNEADNLRKQQVKRAEYEAHLARRRFMQVDPDNRLVADTLEAEWNEKLRQLQETSDYYEAHHRRESEKLKQTQEKAVLKLAKDFPKLWKNPRTPVREKKRMIRFLIEDVTIIRGEDITLHVRFKGGATKTLKLPLPLKGWQYNVTDPKIVEIVDGLLTDHTYAEIATILDERGYKSGQGHQIDRNIVKGITHKYKLKTRFARLRATGKLTVDEVASLLGVITYSYCNVRSYPCKSYSCRKKTLIVMIMCAICENLSHTIPVFLCK
jgi:integrase